MGARTCEEFLSGLSDGRAIWLGNDRVREIVNHPEFAGAARALAAVFDLQHRAADMCLMPDPQTGEPINVSHIIPHSRADLERRHGSAARSYELAQTIPARERARRLVDRFLKEELR
jgi:4-hydroxyphenylacetate 3-monooxygenase